MTNKEAFRLGFLIKVAELGATPAQFATNMEKKSLEIFPTNLLPNLLFAALGAGGLAYLLGQQTGKWHADLVNEYEAPKINEMKIRQLTDVYRQEADRIKIRLKQRRMQQEELPPQQE